MPAFPLIRHALVSDRASQRITPASISESVAKAYSAVTDVIEVLLLPGRKDLKTVPVYIDQVEDAHVKIAESVLTG